VSSVKVVTTLKYPLTNVVFATSHYVNNGSNKTGQQPASQSIARSKDEIGQDVIKILVKITCLVSLKVNYAYRFLIYSMRRWQIIFYVKSLGICRRTPLLKLSESLWNMLAIRPTNNKFHYLLMFPCTLIDRS
jgi:hypothetical protein